MKSITIHGLDGALEHLLRKKAAEEGLSINKTVKKVLARSFGIASTGGPVDHRREFLDLFGVWSERDVEEFKRATSEFDQVNPEDW